MARRNSPRNLAHDYFSLDELDAKIIGLLAAGSSNQEIATSLHKPLSTVQRRTRQLLQSGVIQQRYEIDYKKFGYKTGLFHIYLKNGDTRTVAEKIGEISGITGVSIHIGNSDVLAQFVCRDNIELLKLLAEIKRMPGVVNIVWSEEVYSFPHLRKIVGLPVTTKSSSQRSK